VTDVPGPGAASDHHDRPSGDAIKVWFRFVPREDWLPYDTEGLWATTVGADTAQVKNVPFLQDGVAFDDVVYYETDADGRRWSRRRVEESGNCTIRLLPIPSGPLGRSARAVHEKFAPFGLGGEVFSEDLPLVAMNVPADANFAGIKQLMAAGEEAGWWFAETSCANQRWRDA